MKISDEIRSCVLKACRSGVDQWTSGESPEIIFNALDHLSDEAKLELCLRYCPQDHNLIKIYQRDQIIMDYSSREQVAKPLRDYTPTIEPRGV
jgi:hypothetical protein